MKFSIVILILSAAVMVVMIFQAVRQELDLQNSKTRMAENAEEVNRKEAAINEVKNKVIELKTKLASLNAKMDDLKKTKANAEKSTSDFDKNLQTCNNEKANALMRKTNIEVAISKLKASHVAAGLAAKDTVQKLKTEIVDRDRAICVFADLTKTEAQNLCGAIGNSH
ncbi:uncharacterized protein si:dkey-87o1.2 [Antennarius striatus]|uniref:uncharacterized protein si:dkey-87o1.2 n=1 Tax=Antennarius striatus TaxID=241820 RepID=UPI0035B14220